VEEIEKMQALLVKCKGHLNAMTAKKINKRLTAFLKNSSSGLVLDFGEITHIDPAAIETMLKKLEKHHQRIKLFFQKNQLEKIINRLEGKISSFEIFDCWDTLLASFA
jgi:anti-anti-sigma regulatory factor